MRARLGLVVGAVALGGIAAAVVVGRTHAARVRTLERSERADANSTAREARALHPFVELRAPRVETEIRIDAEDGKKVWESDVGGTGVFKDAAGAGMVPYTEARARWRPGTLYLWLYAGDLDLEGTTTAADQDLSHDDAFHVELGAGGSVYTIDVSVLGTVADARCAGEVGGSRGPAAPNRFEGCDSRWQSGARVAVDRDGTLNRVGDNDEEWIVEMAIPLASLGIRDAGAGTRIPFAVSRCEVGKSGRGACGGFGVGKPPGELVLEAAAVDRVQVATAAGR